MSMSEARLETPLRDINGWSQSNIAEPFYSLRRISKRIADIDVANRLDGFTAVLD
jgi:hypothetical protein